MSKSSRSPDLKLLPAMSLMPCWVHRTTSGNVRISLKLFWIFAACVIATLFTLVPHQGLAALLHVSRVLLADDVRNTGETFAKCAALVREAGGTVLATVEIYDRCESIVDVGVPNVALAEYKAPENYKASECPLCKAGVAITRF